MHAARQFIQLNEHRNERSANPEGQRMSQASPEADLNAPPVLLSWQRSRAKTERACLPEGLGKPASGHLQIQSQDGSASILHSTQLHG